MPILANANPVEHIMDVPWRIGGHDVPWMSSQIAVMILATAILVICIPLFASRALKQKGKAGFGIVEIIVSFVRTQIAETTLGAAADFATPILATLFMFLLMVNLLGLVPLSDISSILGLYGWGGTDASGQPMNVTPIAGTPTSGLWVAAAFAIMTFLLIIFLGYFAQVQILWKGKNGDHGHDDHHTVDAGMNFWLDWSNKLQSRTWPLPFAIIGGFWTWLNSFVPPIAGPIGIIMWPVLLFLEMTGYATKCFALCIRLVSNMSSGHILLAVILMFAQTARHWNVLLIGLPVGMGVVALMVLELVVALLQAYLFTFLSALFVGLAVNPQH